MNKRNLLAVFILAILVYLYSPIALLVAFSFNKGISVGGRVVSSTVTWLGFSLEWYQTLLGEKDLLAAFSLSALIALLVAGISGTIGALAAYSYSRYRFHGKDGFDALLLVPVIIPEIAHALAMLLYFRMTAVNFGVQTIIMGHLTFAIPYTYLVMKARFAGYDRAIEEAAYSLGANEVRTFLTVTVPLIMPGILAGALLAFTLSFDDFVISSFLSGAGINTLPMLIYGRIRFGVNPDINAIATVTLTISTVLVLVSQVVSQRRKS
jgi:spermidine/putrescine transport system permease protein